MEYFVTKEQVCHILKAHGHQVVMDSSFVVGHPISEIEAIVDVCDVIAKAAYDQGDKDATERHIDLQNQMAQRVEELQQFNQDLRVENKELSETVEDLREANRGLADSVVKKSESEELEKAIETIQATLSGSFRDNLKIEVTEQHCWLTYGNLKFLVEPVEAWQAVQSCVYLSGLEVEND